MKSMIFNYSNFRFDYALGIPTCEPFIDFHFRPEIVRDDFISKNLRRFI